MRVNHGRGFSAPAIRFARMFALVGRLEFYLTAGGFFPLSFIVIFLCHFLGGKNSVLQPNT